MREPLLKKNYRFSQYNYKSSPQITNPYNKQNDNTTESHISSVSIMPQLAPPIQKDHINYFSKRHSEIKLNKNQVTINITIGN